MKKKRLLINLISNIIAFGLQLGINFIITPIITEKVGDAAYGFIGLANNFISYASIFTIIINSMASRFITLEITKGNEKRANQYYSSIFILDIIMSGIITIISIFMIMNLNTILDIPSELEIDVKITFLLTFINFVLSVMSTIFTIATFIKNRLDMEAVRNIIGNIIKAIFLIIVFSLYTPKIYYIPMGGILFTLVVMLANIRITKKIAPELKCKFNLYNNNCVKTLAKSGIWNSLNNLSKVLLTGLDLLIANVFVSAEAMGLLSIAKTVPTTIENLLSTMANIFTPQFVILYSKHKIRELVNNVNFSTKLIAFIMIVPIACFIVFGTEFFTLWLPSKTIQEISKIQTLSILSLIPYIVSTNNYSLFILDTVTNKLRRPVIATIILSIVSTITTIILLMTTNLGIYAVAGVSSVYWCIKVIFFNTINAAKNLRIKWNTFFLQFLKNILCFIIILALLAIMKNYLNMETWVEFMGAIILVGILGYIVVFYLLFGKSERKRVVEMIKIKIHKNNP